MIYLLIFGYGLPALICLTNLVKGLNKREAHHSSVFKHLLCCLIPIVNFWVALWFIVALLFDCAGFFEDLIYKRNDKKGNVL